MNWNPHSYQKEALSFTLANKRSGLFLDPGLGKTSISLSAIRILRDADLTSGVLMVAPLRVIKSVWPNEIIKWGNFKSVTHTILHGKGKLALWGSKVDIYLINPEGLAWLVDELLDGLKKGRKCPFNTLWIDESTKFKNPTSDTLFKTVLTMLPLFKRRYIMTGTPAPKSYIDLWSQIYILDDGKALGSNFYRFRNKYFKSDDWNKYTWYLKEGAKEDIQKAISHLVLDMSQKDHLDIPDVTYNNISVKLAPKAAAIYKEMEVNFFAVIDDEEMSASAAAQAGMACHQIANGRIYENVPEDLTPDEEKQFRKTRKTLMVHKGKMEAVRDLVDELNGKPVLIAYHYKHDLKALKELFGANVPYIGSGVSDDQIARYEKDWNAGMLPVLLGYPGSMGHGLNLQNACNDVCWYSLTWNLEEYIQFNKRVHRQGVKGAVRVHHIITDGTIDQAMLMRLGSKAKDQEDLRKALKRYRLFPPSGD